MNINEIRVGNYFYSRNITCFDCETKISDNVFTVLEIERDRIKIDTGRGQTESFAKMSFEDFFNPIEITNDILINWFGFKHKIKHRNKNRTSEYFLRDSCSKMVQKYRRKYYLQNVTIFDPEAIKIKYVHELQNLYFEMTGYELKPMEKK